MKVDLVMKGLNKTSGATLYCSTLNQTRTAFTTWTLKRTLTPMEQTILKIFSQAVSLYF